MVMTYTPLLEVGVRLIHLSGDDQTELPREVKVSG